MEQGTHRIAEEIKEITVRSVQELLHKLLRVEATVQERNCRGKEQDTSSQSRRVVSEHKSVEKLSITQKDQTKEAVTRQGSEMSLKFVKCFECQEKGHLAKFCSHSRKKGVDRVTVNRGAHTTRRTT